MTIERKKATQKDLDELDSQLPKVDKTAAKIGRSYPSIEAAENSIRWLRDRRRQRRAH
jgi:flagellin-like hook-associated protein FlgL